MSADFADVKKAVKDGDATIVDVRNPEELKTDGKIPTSISLPLPEIKEAVALSEDNFKKRYGVARPGERDPLILHCRGGVRAQKAAALLTEAGFSNLRVYQGSFADWVSQGGPVDK
ncbi:rhodanese domain-containing protein CG4456-like isoform X2 [Pollicipes pollicipes]|uniref:rhodanese domain-containing protein CG4456-like isoform X2 n=1 Tax=Pollicipes pollicipes TaxID=41117 RepID=UPI0018852288|nr:rhodanese domain-containing protein CG4456-like isoform X2 [Pollicipes pollicipes]